MQLVEAQKKGKFFTDKKGNVHPVKGGDMPESVQAKLGRIKKKVKKHAPTIIGKAKETARGAVIGREAGQELGHELGAAEGGAKGTKAGMVVGGAAGVAGASTLGRKVAKGALKSVGAKATIIGKKEGFKHAGRFAAAGKKITAAAKKLAPKGKLGQAIKIGAIGAGIGGAALGALGRAKGAEIGERKLGRAGMIAGAGAGLAGQADTFGAVARGAAKGAARGRAKGTARGKRIGTAVGAAVGAGIHRLAGKSIPGRIGAAIIGAGLGRQFGGATFGRKHARRGAALGGATGVVGQYSPEAATLIQGRIKERIRAANTLKARGAATITGARQQYGQGLAKARRFAKQFPFS